MSKHIDDADPKAERINREIVKATDRLIAEMRRAVKREFKRFSSDARHHWSFMQP